MSLVLGATIKLYRMGRSTAKGKEKETLEEPAPATPTTESPEEEYSVERVIDRRYDHVFHWFTSLATS